MRSIDKKSNWTPASVIARWSRLLSKCRTLVRMQEWWVARQFAAVLASRTPTVNSVTGGRTVVVAPHPDDEVLGAGGMIAMKRVCNTHISIVILSDGADSHSTCCRIGRETVATMRKRQATDAMAELGVSDCDLRWCSLADQRIPNPGSVAYSRALRELCAILQDAWPEEVYCPHRLDCWPDHEAAARLTVAAVRTLRLQCRLHYYLIWANYKLPLRACFDLGWSRAWRLDIRSVRNKKLAAVDRYFRSEVAPCGQPYAGRLPRQLISAATRAYELFFVEDALSQMHENP